MMRYITKTTGKTKKAKFNIINDIFYISELH